MKSVGLMSYGTCSSVWKPMQFNVPSRSCLCVALKQLRPRTSGVCASPGSCSKLALGSHVLLVEVKALHPPAPVAGGVGVVNRPIFRGSFNDSSEFLRSETCVWTYGTCFLSLGRDGKRSLTIVAGKKGRKAERDHVLVKEREEDLDEEEEKGTTTTTATTTTTTSEDEESTKGKKKLNKAKKKQDTQQQQLENGDHAIAAAEDRITGAQLKKKKKELKEVFQKNDVLLGQLKKKADEEDEEEEEDSPDEQLENQSSDDVTNGTTRSRQSDSRKLQEKNKHKADKKKLKSKAKTEDLHDKEEEDDEGEEASAAKDADDCEIEMKGKEKTRKQMSKHKKPQVNSSVADQDEDLNEKMEANADEFADDETFQEFKDTDPLANVIENELAEELDELRLDDEEFWEEDSELEPEVGDGGEGGGVVLGDSLWGQTVLDLATVVLAEFNGDIAIFAFKVSKESGVIRVRLDKLSDKYGSPTIDEIQRFSSSYSKTLGQAGEAGIIPKNLALEVSSPGAERVLHIPQDLERFKQQPMYVRYLEGGEEKETEGKAKEKDGILELESVDAETGSSVWKLANVHMNRELVGKGRALNKKRREWRRQLPFESIQLVRLYIDL